MPESKTSATADQRILVKAFDWASEYDLKQVRALIEKQPGTRILHANPFLAQFSTEKIMALFDYGAVVFFNFQNNEVLDWGERLKSCAQRPNKTACEDDFTLFVSTQGKEPVGTDELHIREFNRDIALAVSIVLSRSVSLEFYEKLVAESLAVIEVTVNSVAEKGWSPRRTRDLTKHVGFSLSVEHALAYNVSVLDDPDVLWDGGRPVERLYSSLKREFDLEDRVKIIRHKISIISRSSTFLITRLDSQRSEILEWVIIILILSEIALALLGKF